MTISPQNLREQHRLASDALARAELGLDSGANIYAQLDVSDTQLKQVRRGLVQKARTQLAFVAETTLKNLEPAGLPGLPRGRDDGADGGVLSAAQAALASAWSSLAEFETLRGAKDASIAAYRKALEFAPDDLVANAQLADLLESGHDLENAKTHAERALRADAKHFTASMALARVLMRQDQFVQAERAAMNASKAGASADDRALAWGLVGEARDRRGDTAGAFAAFTQANKLMLQRYGQLREASHPAHPANVRRLTEFVARASGISAPAAQFSTPAPAFLIGFPR